MAIHHDVKLVLLDTGTEITNVWDEYDVAVDMFRPGNPWTYTLWHSREAETANEQTNRRTAWTTIKREVKLGGLISFSIDGAPQLVGVIERIKYHRSREHGAMFVMSGRDIAVTAIDWDADPTINLRSQTLNDVLTRLFRPLGMTVTFGIDTDGEREVRLGRRAGSRGLSSHRRTQNVDIFHPKPGERIWQLAETLCRRLGYLLWVAPGADGTFNVVVDVPNYDADSVFLFKHRWLDGSQSQATADSNVIDMDFDAQTANIPTAVTVYGRSCRGDTSAARMRATLTNTELSRFPIVSQNAKPRIRHLHASRARTSDHADQEAKRVIADSMRDFRIHSVSVQGHGQASNDQMNLFSINTMAHVKDSLAELDEAMLIHRVEFKGSRKAGQTTRVTLGTQGAVVLVPAESGSTGSSGSSGGGGGLDLGDITHF